MGPSMHQTRARNRRLRASITEQMSEFDPELPLANGSYQGANHGTRFRYSGRFIFRSNAL